MKMPKPKDDLERLNEKYSVEEVLSRISCRRKSKNTYVRENFNGHMINLNVTKLIVFKVKGCTCVGCGISGSFFVKERAKDTNFPYCLNLYALDNGNEILMTQDHIVPLFKGGKNFIDNLQPMCKICNELKDHPKLTKCPVCGGEKKATNFFCEKCT